MKTLDDLISHLKTLPGDIQPDINRDSFEWTDYNVKIIGRSTGRTIIGEKMYKAYCDYKAHCDYNLAMHRLQNEMQKTTFAEHIKNYE